ncbi:hypothetical protein [Bacillus thuringiensis]|nr:hypothetical protein [Bacillus thuringiensis]
MRIKKFCGTCYQHTVHKKTK